MSWNVEMRERDMKYDNFGRRAGTRRRPWSSLRISSNRWSSFLR